jgi:hypothetical protein
MSGTKEFQTGSNATRGALRRAAKYAIASSVTAGVFLSVAALAPAAQAATAQAATSSPAKATARIQALLDSPAGGTVNLPHGTFTVRPTLRLQHGEQIVGHGTTLRVASGTGDYRAVLTGATATTDLSGLTITGVTFDQNSSGNPIRDATVLYKGSPRFVVLVVRGIGINIVNDRFVGTNNVNTIVTGEATSNVQISGNVFSKTLDAPMHDHSSTYTSGTGTVIRNNTFTGRAAYATAIEVHGDQVSVTGNRVSGYYKAANIVSSDTTFHGNHVHGAGNPVDLWSIAPTALHNVKVTDNLLNRNRPYWKHVLARLGRTMPAACYTRQVIREAVSTLPFHNITIHGNHG